MSLSEHERKRHEIDVEAPTVVRVTQPLAADPLSDSNSKSNSNSKSDATAENPAAPDERTIISRRPSMEAPSFVSPADSAQVLIGRRLDHFVLEDLIGGGGMGAVFRARDTRLDRIVAVKVLPRVGQDPDLLRRFRVEAQSAARLDHPNIARIYDVGQQDGWHYIVFEHIQGVNIRDLVARNGVLSIAQAVLFTYQAAEAIGHAAERGVVHRDVKPSNLLVDSQSHLKLVDMGLARSQAVELSDDLTASNVTLGTFDYISPEQARDPRAADVRSDLYSLGCSLYYMLTGEPPYPGGTVVQKLLSHGSTPPPDPRRVRGDVSDDLAAILFKLLSKRPEHRYQEAGDLIADLAELARRERLGLTAMAEVSSHLTAAVGWSRWWNHHLPWLVAFAMLVTSVVGLRLATPKVPLLTVPDLQRTAAETISSPPLPQTPAVPAPVAVPEVPPPTPASVGGAPEPAVTTQPAATAGDTKPAEVAAPAAMQDPRAFPTTPSPIPPEISGAGGASIAPAATVMTQVVVAPLGRASTDGQIVVTTLEEAIRTASLVPEIETIEIDAERLESGPIKIPRSGLMIRGAASRPTVSLVFRQSNANIYRMQRPAMIETNGHKLRMEHLHLNWNLPTSVGDGGAMFRLLAGDSLALRDCSLTLENLSQREEVYGIEVVSDTPSSSFRDLTTVAKSTTLELSSILARGEMSFINTPDAVPVGLRWNNGLLAVTGRLLETGGSDLLQSETAVAMRLRLTRVTLFGRGMVQVRAGPSGRNAPRIERICDSCVIVNQLSLAQIDLRNLPRMPDKVVPWLIAGENNLYENDLDPVVRVTTSTPMQKEWSFPEAQKELWYQERSPEFGIQWLAVAWPPDKPAYQLEVSDFMQKSPDVGFDTESPPPTPPNL